MQITNSGTAEQSANPDSTDLSGSDRDCEGVINHTPTITIRTPRPYIFPADHIGRMAFSRACKSTEARKSVGGPHVRQEAR